MPTAHKTPSYQEPLASEPTGEAAAYAAEGSMNFSKTTKNKFMESPI